MITDHAKKIAKFALVSGTGLGIDFAIYLVLIWFSVSPFFANLTSATCAVSFVYLWSVRRIFNYEGNFLFGIFIAYVIYQGLAVAAASLAIAWLAATQVSAPLAKILVLPLTFGANYIFLFFLTRGVRNAPR